MKSEKGSKVKGAEKKEKEKEEQAQQRRRGRCWWALAEERRGKDGGVGRWRRRQRGGE